MGIMMFIIIFISFFISLILIFINSTISTKMEMNREKISPFECGYDPKSMARLPFSLHFFLLAVIFLIFDVEITIIIPLPLLMKILNTLMWSMLSVMFIIILLFGTIHEWNEGSLDWTK